MLYPAPVNVFLQLCADMLTEGANLSRLSSFPVPRHGYRHICTANTCAKSKDDPEASRGRSSYCLWDGLDDAVKHF